MMILCHVVMMLAVMLFTIAALFLLLRYYSATERSPKHAKNEDTNGCLFKICLRVVLLLRLRVDH